MTDGRLTAFRRKNSINAKKWRLQLSLLELCLLYLIASIIVPIAFVGSRNAHREPATVASAYGHPLPFYNYSEDTGFVLSKEPMWAIALIIAIDMITYIGVALILWLILIVVIRAWRYILGRKWRCVSKEKH